MDAGCESLRIIILLSLTSFYDSNYWLNKLSLLLFLGFRVNFYFLFLFYWKRKFIDCHFIFFSMCTKRRFSRKIVKIHPRKSFNLKFLFLCYLWCPWSEIYAHFFPSSRLSRSTFITFTSLFSQHVVTLKSPKRRAILQKIKCGNSRWNFSFP